MIGADAARDGDDGGDVAHGGQEHGVHRAQRVQLGQRPDGAEHHRDVHRPDADGAEQEGPFVLHPRHAGEAGAEPLQDAGDAAEQAHPPAQQDHGGEEADEQHAGQDDDQDGRSAQAGVERPPDVVGEEGCEGVPFEGQRRDEDGRHGEHVEHAFAHDGAEPLVEAHPAGRDIAAAHEFAGAGQHHADQVAHVKGVPDGQAPHLGVQRLDERVPALRTEDERQHRGGEIQGDPTPSRLLQALPESFPVHAPEGEPNQHHHHKGESCLEVLPYSRILQAQSKYQRARLQYFHQ